MALILHFSSHLLEMGLVMSVRIPGSLTVPQFLNPA